ncbi:phospholipase [Variovorax sp. NFACC27]|uniref:alpha/beta hydrolase n=1 Tax=unclassified Variovorax TaxID=663243 RepID=UPI000896F363|nr:phospholipase/carboxylesterase [Variovorax sp. NFACC28]SEG91264.1 phospholipase/carboxylesterase [Variovorax sp. NFACC29]SFD48582.1 phospholipase/carboxylesterase [Variovorax sp. NFACC26]SFG73171.1 phospholipase/carboxylesterase [Variovorax sp. NFACC27]
MTQQLHLPLKFLAQGAQPDVREPWLLVLMHGVGSNEQDLFGLARMLPPQFHVLSLRAPYVLSPDSYAWFEFDVLPSGERRIDEEQERESRFLVGEMVASASQQLGVPPERIVVGGFSQGGIMALSLLLTRPESVRAALVWHSRLLPQVVPHIAPPEAFEGKALWVSHGSADNVIPPSAAQATRELARTLPLKLSGTDFPGAHEIRPAELQATLAWLQSLGAPASV